jgi:S-DNA-T family DNA segregation ATPase FtsK/SpoIIIE
MELTEIHHPVLVGQVCKGKLGRTLALPLHQTRMRVLFPMSGADSSTLIDNPAASKLGVHRALFHSEDSSEPEKFRPYGLPTEEWLAWVRERISQKV